jgi:hypothetical protein
VKKCNSFFLKDLLIHIIYENCTMSQIVKHLTMHLLVYDFDVYMGKTNVQADVLALLRRDGNLAQGVVLKLMDGLENEG